jgi:hypothetical protein
MAGYNWAAGKSNRAVAAEAAGRMTATAFAQWVRKWRRYAGCTAADVAGALPASEWHHTSKFFNRTCYYDPLVLLCAEYRAELIKRIGQRKEYAKIRKRLRDRAAHS